MDSAQVLIVTQQRIERMIGTGSFNKCPQLFYRGKPRAVRIWDESWMPGDATSLDADSILGLVPLMKDRRRFDLVTTFKALARAIDKAPDNSLVDVPNFAHSTGWDLNLALGAVRRDGSKTAEKTVTLLWRMSGHRARVRQDGAMGGAALVCEETLPADLAPMIVLDASARVRQTYSNMTDRRNVKRLREAVANYSNLSVYWWNKGAGGSAFERTAKGCEELIEGVAKTILTKPDQSWLVVHHRKGRGVIDVRAEVTGRLPVDVLSNVHFVSWGRHQSSNAFQDCTNVILAGTLFTRLSTRAALTHLTQDVAPEWSPVTDDDIERLTIGEHRHYVLQAACRGRIRQGKPMSLYLIAAKRHGIHEALPDVFPGMPKVLPWKPETAQTTDKVCRLAEAIGRLDEVLAVGIPEVPESLIRGTMDKGNWAKRVAGTDQWAAALAERGLVQVKLAARGSPTVLRLAQVTDITD